ncbi:S1C family serine protease [Tuwongella immobilis]|uniref:PDZ domain-containing protein n=1 Tax=Tuwongella immobilis TaxID=692036 RepID=A0A6C2YQ90_9BACT|nr:trypsin-like peptidase domain-containing protein [Tuwongella immobilis]VIP03564.1 2-alkenal reductase : Trypsin-like serine protease with C-terminal PDZ domain OS=Singulisphaera acidiphila (strain ATCC BAA-1392 / DSM 18658 / VKM B-2454 / MOB10) GN=Sinac_1093 PE=4 SV=1: Trypsin_2: PDZ_2 [Tuwongella immobilis]VTS04496.1 2-alkenal reductase : Trypsin-like serine protease with C-terminal PDZ domain OS=Singulisphaera acidiphila (strain ATCC BAA-1392 / DSM 18658 / VKM B-2454 / MOB10) GN=Sinac_1093 P
MRTILAWVVVGVFLLAVNGMGQVAPPMPPVAQPPLPPAANPPEAGDQPSKPADSLLGPMNSQPLELSPEEATNVRVYEIANRSVVNITTRGTEDSLLFAPTRQGSGSGCILNRDGYILTNHHVIDGADEITVTLADGSSHSARWVGSDPNNDLAVVRINAPAEVLRPMSWGDSDRLVVGQRVYALGNPFGLERTMTAGMVSSLGRTLRTDNGRLIRGVIQTDAAINPGNSGGPLLNRRGELVGITTAIISRAGQSSGVGLAVPGNTVRRVAEELIRHGRVVRADCGIEAAVRTDRGLLIARLTPRGPAEQAGIRGPELRAIQRGALVYWAIDRAKADVVVAVDGKPVRTMDELFAAVETHQPGEEAMFTVLRNGKSIKIPVELVESR